MGKVSSREEEFLDVLKKRQKLSMTEIVTYFSISDSTARRLCVSLEKKGKIIRGFGGIYYSPDVTSMRTEYQYDVLEGENALEKSQIGAYASGHDAALDQAIQIHPQLERFLQQPGKLQVVINQQYLVIPHIVY